MSKVKGKQVEIADINKQGVIPANPLAEVGKSYSLAPLPDGSYGWAEAYSPPPVTTFVEGWVSYPWSKVEAVLNQGAQHAAASVGDDTPTVGAVTFEATGGGGADTSIPLGTWTGTNWVLRRNNATFNPNAYGNNTGRTEVTTWPDGNDPSLGSIAGAVDLCNVAMRRGWVFEVSGLTVGNQYYFIPIFWGYPGTTTFTAIQPYDDTNTLIPNTITTFAFDGAGMSLNEGIKRFGFVATDTTMKFSRFSPDNSGSYVVGFAVTDQGTP